MSTELIVDRTKLYAVIMCMSMDEHCEKKSEVLLYTKSLNKAQALFNQNVENPPTKEVTAWTFYDLYIVLVPLGKELKTDTLIEEYQIDHHEFEVDSTESKDAFNFLDSTIVSAENKIIISLSTEDGDDLLYLLMSEEEYEKQWKALLDQAEKVHSRTSTKHIWNSWSDKINLLLLKLSNTKKFYHRALLKLTGPVVNFVHIDRWGYWT